MGDVHHAPIQERFVGPVDAALARCARLHASDKRAESLGRLIRIAGLVTAGLSLGVVITVGQDVRGALIGGFVGLAVGVLLFVAGMLMRRGDLEDRKLEIVRFVLARLGPELSHKRPVEMHIDFRGYTVAQTQGGKHFGAYQHPWLDLSFVLLDGSYVRVRAVLHAKQKKKPKNKYTKVKESAYEVLRVQVAPPSQRTFRAPGLAVHPPKPHGLSLRRALIRPVGAELVWSTSVLRRSTMPSGIWNKDPEELLDGPRVLDALISSYKTLALNERSHAA